MMPGPVLPRLLLFGMVNGEDIALSSAEYVKNKNPKMAAPIRDADQPSRSLAH